MDESPGTIEYNKQSEQLRNSQGFAARSTNFATGAPMARETREQQYMNTTNNS